MKHAHSPLPSFLTMEALATRLAVNPKTIRRWIDAGDLRAHRLGRQLRISEQDAAAFVSRRRV